jgi:hypothetical protein
VQRLFARAPDEVWGLAGDRYVVRWDGTTWKDEYCGRNLGAIWAADATRSWAADLESIEPRTYGPPPSWSPFPGEVLLDPAQPAPRWWAIWGRAAGDIWVLGATVTTAPNYPGRVLHHDGARWIEHTFPRAYPEATALDIWGGPGIGFWVVGDSGLIAFHP